MDDLTRETYRRIAAEVTRTATPAEAETLRRVMEMWQQAERTPSQPTPEIVQHIGRFDIPERLVRDQPHAVAYAMHGMLVTRCEHDYAERTFRYTAMAAQFRPIAEGDSIPHYDLRITGNVSDDASIPPCVSIVEWQGKR